VSQPYWNVRVAVEFLRKDRLESELLKQMAAALQAVEGVEAVTQDHREASSVAGAPSGEALVRAAAQVVDRLAVRARAYLDSMTYRSGQARQGRPRVDLAAVRAWARQSGFEISERGRISAEVIGQYEATQ
jgi:hypothetical protein